MLLSRVAAVAVLAGCPSSDLPVCHVVPPDSGGPGGSNGIEAVLVAATIDGTLIEIYDGSQVPLVRAPQGGHIMLVGAKLKGTSDCMLDATGALRDPATGRVIGLDERSLLLTSDSAGWSRPSAPPLSSMPNVAVCPSSAAVTAIDGNPYTLEVTLRDDANHDTLAMLTAAITPACSADDTYCHSDCAPPAP